MAEKSRITEAGFVISLIAGIIILGVAFAATFLARDIIATYGKIISIFAYFLLVSNYIAGVMIVVGSILIKHEDHSLSGSIIVLIMSLVGIVSGMGVFVGPICGIIGGVVGLREHQHLILHKKEY
ncbi:MAG: hypothetical protein JSW18_00165 [Candidatus Omnitrophota bacterium]|nr:MAG: hypothetical protein JSW18_00165 [Candidatus Omnitrophota bacterium]